MTASPPMDDHPLLALLRRVPPLLISDTIWEAAARIGESGGGLPVVDEGGRLVGYLGESDLLRAICPGYLGQLADTEFFIRDLSAMARSARRGADDLVERHLSPEPTVLHATDSATHAAELFLHHGVRSLPVVDDEGRVIGVLRIGDLISSLLRAAREAT